MVLVRSHDFCSNFHTCISWKLAKILISRFRGEDFLSPNKFFFFIFCVDGPLVNIPAELSLILNIGSRGEYNKELIIGILWKQATPSCRLVFCRIKIVLKIVVKGH